MAKKIILGSDFGRDAFKAKVNENFTELYDKDVALGESINDLDADKANKIDIIQTTEVNDSTKMPSSAVTYNLQQQIKKLYDITNVDFVTDFNGDGNAQTPGRWRVYSADGTLANAPYAGFCRGYVDVIVEGDISVTGSNVYQTFYDFFGDIYYKKIEINSNFGTWKKLTNQSEV